MQSDDLKSIELEQTSCSLCGARHFRFYMKGRDLLYGVPGEFWLVRCQGCGHVYLNPRPTLRTIGACYPVNYGPHQTEQPHAAGNQKLEAELRSPWYLSPAARRIPGLRKFYYWLADEKTDYFPIVDSSPKRALEIGCGTGNYLRSLRERGWEVQGVEPAEAPARHTRTQGFDVHIGTLESAKFPDASFDAVFAWMVLEHLHEPRETLREVRRVLKPAGWLIFSIPNIACWERRLFGKYWYALQLPTHLQHFTPRSVSRMLNEAGFDTVTLMHQRNLNNVVGSVGNWLHGNFPHSKFGLRLIDYTNHPTMWCQLALAPAAKLLALLRQGGRLTVAARARQPEASV